MSAPGIALDAGCPAPQDFRFGTAQARQRQPSGLAVSAVSARLVRDELTAKKRNAAQAEYHRLAASV